MNKAKQLATSRTVWTIVAMFVIGGVNNVASFVPAADLVYVNLGLSALAMYFHINPSQDYTPKA